MKKLQATTKAATEKFDESFKRLFEKKLKCEMSIYQVGLEGFSLCIIMKHDIFCMQGLVNPV